MDTQADLPSHEPTGLLLDEDRLGLVTDLYELTMSAAYWSVGLSKRWATFDLFFRQLPPARNYMVAAGLEQAVHYLRHFQFTPEDIDYLRQLPIFAHVPIGWFEELASLRFTGDVWAVPEGTIVFPGEPLLRVSGPLAEAQIAETYLLATVGYQTSVATKSSRINRAARGRDVVDFGTRRGHGPQAGLWAARASFIGGCMATSNVAAAKQLAIPTLGTMAHAWVMAIDDEREAFERFAAIFPNRPTYLIDTFDTHTGARNALRTQHRPGQVRIDSGDLATVARDVRQILDSNGASDVKIFASGDLNEYKIEALVASGAPIDAFGVGTELTTVADAPALSCVYKLVELSEPSGDSNRSGRIKMSSGKRTFPGRKQIFRQFSPAGHMSRDIVGLESEPLPGQPLLEPVVCAGQLIRALPSLREIQQKCRHELERLPDELLAIHVVANYEVTMSERIEEEFDRVRRARGPGTQNP